jgi:pilus assembly protein Flp/PilA
MERLVRFLRDEEGVTSIEYALIAALIAMVIIVAVSFVGDQASDTYEHIANEVAGAGS